MRQKDIYWVQITLALRPQGSISTRRQIDGCEASIWRGLPPRSRHWSRWRWRCLELDWGGGGEEVDREKNLRAGWQLDESREKEHFLKWHLKADWRRTEGGGLWLDEDKCWGVDQEGRGREEVGLSEHAVFLTELSLSFISESNWKQYKDLYNLYCEVQASFL